MPEYWEVAAVGLETIDLRRTTGAFEDNHQFRNHTLVIFTCIFDNLITDYLQTHRSRKQGLARSHFSTIVG